jgi:DedD protein
METPVKERLVGAAILVGLIVVLVPEMLSGPRDSETGGAPQDEDALRTYTIDLSAPDKVAQEVESSPKRPPLESEAPEPKPEPAPEAVKPPPAPEAKTQPSPPLEERVAAPPSRKASVTSTSGWAVQVGSFASAENAQKVVGELRAQGYKAFVSTAGTGQGARHRVRIGPEKARTQAQKLADRLKRNGRQVTVVSHP